MYDIVYDRKAVYIPVILLSPRRSGGNFVIYYLIGIVPIKAMICQILSGIPPGCRYSLHSAAALPVLEKDQSLGFPESF